MNQYLIVITPKFIKVDFNSSPGGRRMAQKTQGYIHLFWNCPQCKSKNIGTDKVCAQCGSPQPANVEFYQQDDTELIKDEAEIKKAALGPDINCPYCTTRNAADAKICVQCGGDISEGARRKSGQILGAFKPGQKTTIICASCGSENAITLKTCHQCGTGLGMQPNAAAPIPLSTDKKKMNPLVLVLLVLGAMVICGLIISGISSLFSKKELRGTVESATWLYTVNVERYGPVQAEDWQANIPAEATNLSCEPRYNHDENEPVAGAVEVCGTPYTKDNGNGYAEVVQDCVYQVSEPYCSYDIMGWQSDQQYSSTGTDMNPFWPDYTLSSDQRVADQTESYTVLFSSDSKQYEYSPSTYSEFSVCEPGSEWNLTVNGFDSVLSISPAN
jgi:hypothetical protein